MSAEGFAVMALMHTEQGPARLYDSFGAGKLTVRDLRELLWYGWVYRDSPTSVLPADSWVSMFRTVGFFSWPEAAPLPGSAFTAYRSATAERARGMSWTGSPELAEIFGRRHSRHDQAHLYRAEVSPDAVLALLLRVDDEGWTIVVDAAQLGAITAM
jgi:hypothetical protein